MSRRGLEGCLVFLETIMLKPWADRPLDPTEEELLATPIATGVSILIKQTKLPQNVVAKRFSVIPSRLSVMLARNGPWYELQMNRAAQIAKEHMLLNLEGYFFNKAQQCAYKHGKSKRPERPAFYRQDYDA